MHPTRLTPILALALIATVALAQTTLYDNCYPNACVGTLLSAHWPFGGTPPQALVAIGSPAFADYYNLTNQLKFLNVPVGRPQSRWLNGSIIPGNIKSGLGNSTTGIGIGFTALGEFVTVLNNNIGGGLALARFNTTTADLRVTETLAVDTSSIRPEDWINGWTLSANLTLIGPSQIHWIFIHAFALYSNGTHAGGGRGVALNITTASSSSSLSYPPRKWKVLPFDSSDIQPFTIVYDSPRLLVATGGVRKEIELTTVGGPSGHYVTIEVNFTLIFPKAWPYAIVYYNYSVTASLRAFSPYTVYINRTAFSIRSAIYQVSGSLSYSYEAAIFEISSCGGEDYNLFHATPFALNYRNITMFAAVYPKASEYTPWNATKFVPTKTNDFNIVLPTGFKKTSLAEAGTTTPAIPYLILQWKSDELSGQYYATAATPSRSTTYKDGVMFIYGYAYNVTDWVGGGQVDSYIKALIERTVFHLPNVLIGGPCSSLKYRIGVAGSMADPTDVLALGYVASRIRAAADTDVPWYGLDIAPGAFQNLYTGLTTTGMANFIGLRNFGGLPVVLARLNSTFPYFYDRYNRFAFNKTFMMNVTRPVGRIDDDNVWAIFTVGGPIVNMLTRYTQDFVWYAPFIHNYVTAPFPFAFSRYYMAHTPYIGSLFTTVWNTARLFTANNAWPPITTTVTRGYAIISTAVDPNGTVILQVWGANAQDTYFAGKLLTDQPDTFSDAPAFIVVFTYDYRWRYPPTASPFFVTANVYKLSPIERPTQERAFRLKFDASTVDVKFQS